MEIIVHNELNFNEQNQSPNYLHAEDLAEIDDNSCESINLMDSLEFTDDPDSLIKTTLKKLRLGGTLSIIGNDLYEISRQLVTVQIDPRKACNLFYNGRKILFGAYEIRTMLNSLGMYNLNVDVNGTFYSIEGIRDDNSV